MKDQTTHSKESVTHTKSKLFAIRIIRFYKYLTEEKKEFIISKQLMRSGTSIGANIREAQRAQSEADFYAKLFVSLKEADESAYWLELLHDSQLLTPEQFDSIYADCTELIKLLVSITHKKFANSPLNNT
jgi:four helix bundle protein